MKARIICSVVAMMLAIAMLFGFVGCGETPVDPDNGGNTGSNGNTGSGGNTANLRNENDPLVFSTLEVDKVFNPFFSTSGTDSNVVGMTQMSMLGNDKDGDYTYGPDEAVVVNDVQIITTGTGDDQKTTYYFVLKNNIKYSNGSPLTMKDVLFNLYVYLDPVYTGSSTIYSTDIVGLQAYRTQAGTKEEQESYLAQFKIVAQTRIDALLAAVTDVFDENKNVALDDATMAELLKAKADDPDDTYYDNVANDYAKAKELFLKELDGDYTASLDAYADTVFKDEAGNLHKPLRSDTEMFLYNEGYISWNKKDGKLVYACGEDAYQWDRATAVKWVFDAMIPDSIAEVVTYWATASQLFDYLTAAAQEEANKGQTLRFPNISGIQFANRLQPVAVNGTTYSVPTYDANGAVTSGNEVLSITINGVDPKAIWNFAFAVAPMYYYSDAAHIAAFNYVNSFGVERESQTFMETVVNAPSKIGVPMGAGPYAASKAAGGFEGITLGDFCDKGVIYFERNPYYTMGPNNGPALIKKVRFQVVSGSQMLNTLYNGEIDWAEPNAKYETVEELKGKADEGIGYKTVQTAGYGYIGINAGKVPTMAVRQAIMHSINTQLCVDYYKGEASAIYRPMSLSSWAYPEGCTPYYPYIGGKVPANLEIVNPAYKEFCEDNGLTEGMTPTIAQQEAFIMGLVEDAGYHIDASTGIYVNSTGHKLEYTFTVAGEETDHPAWTAMDEAGKFLSGIGFRVTTRTDTFALNKLATGDLTVWAAAWGSTIDPDMYQVYHKESKASSTWNWGYREIIANAGNLYDEELALVESLSELIDLGRKTTNQAERESIYRDALDIVMKLAVELPTYQRDDLFAFNTNKIDTSTLTPDSELSSFKGLTSDIQFVSLKNKER